MKTVEKTSELNEKYKDILATRLKKEAIVSNDGRLMWILLTLFAKKKYLNKLGKREGQELQLNFPGYGLENYCVTFTLSSSPTDPKMVPSDNPKAIITFNVEPDKVVPLLADVVRTKYGLKGIAKILFKFVLTGKIKFKGSLGALLAMLKCMLIGYHDMYKKKD